MWGKLLGRKDPVPYTITRRLSAVIIIIAYLLA